MRSQTNQQCPKRARMHRACVDSLKIPASGPCNIRPLSAPGIAFLPQSVKPPCSMKLPICSCEQNCCPHDTCSAINSGRESPFHHDNINDEHYCSGPCRQEDGGGKNVEENELDVPFSREASCDSEQQDMDENNEEVGIRSPVCPRSYSPLVTNQNATSRKKDQEQRDQMSNVLNRDCGKSCRHKISSPAGIPSGRKISKPDILMKSMSSIRNVNKTGNIQPDTSGRNFRHPTRLNEAETVNVSKLPQTKRFQADLNEIPITGENTEHYSSEDDERDSCCGREYCNSPNNAQEFQNIQEFHDQSIDATKSSRTYMKSNYINESGPNTYSRVGSNLNTSTRTAQNKNTMGRPSLLKESKTSEEPIQNALTINPAGKLCQKCNSTSMHTSLDRMTTTTTSPYVQEENVKEYAEDQNQSTLTSARGSFQRQKHNVDEFIDDSESDKDEERNACCIRDENKPSKVDEPNPCCVRKTAETHAHAPSSRQLEFTSSSRNMLLINDRHDQSPPRRQSNNKSSDCDSCCKSYNSRAINNIKLPRDNSNSKFTSDYKIGPQKQLNKGLSNSQTRFQERKEQGFDNVALPKLPKQSPSCCSHGISKFIADIPERHVNKSNATIDCLCSDGKKGVQRKKIAPCDHEIGATSCTSMKCAANTSSRCGCRYPPALKQFSCTGNINGSCNCDNNI